MSVNPNIPPTVEVGGSQIVNSADPRWIDGGPSNTTPTFNIDDPNFWIPMTVLSGLASGFCERAAVVSSSITGFPIGLTWVNEASSGHAGNAAQTAKTANNIGVAGGTATIFTQTASPIGIAPGTTNNYMASFDSALSLLIKQGGYVTDAGSRYADFDALALAARANAARWGYSISLPTYKGTSYAVTYKNAFPADWAKERKWMLEQLRYTGETSGPTIGPIRLYDVDRYTLPAGTYASTTVTGGTLNINGMYSAAITSANVVTTDLSYAMGTVIIAQDFENNTHKMYVKQDSCWAAPQYHASRISAGDTKPANIYFGHLDGGAMVDYNTLEPVPNHSATGAQGSSYIVDNGDTLKLYQAGPTDTASWINTVSVQSGGTVVLDVGEDTESGTKYYADGSEDYITSVDTTQYSSTMVTDGSAYLPFSYGIEMPASFTFTHYGSGSATETRSTGLLYIYDTYVYIPTEDQKENGDVPAKYWSKGNSSTPTNSTTWGSSYMYAYEYENAETMEYVANSVYTLNIDGTSCKVKPPVITYTSTNVEEILDTGTIYLTGGTAYVLSEAEIQQYQDALDAAQEEAEQNGTEPEVVEEPNIDYFLWRYNDQYWEYWKDVDSDATLKLSDLSGADTDTWVGGGTVSTVMEVFRSVRSGKLYLYDNVWFQSRFTCGKCKHLNLMAGARLVPMMNNQLPTEPFNLDCSNMLITRNYSNMMNGNGWNYNPGQHANYDPWVYMGTSTATDGQALINHTNYWVEGRNVTVKLTYSQTTEEYGTTSLYVSNGATVTISGHVRVTVICVDRGATVILADGASLNGAAIYNTGTVRISATARGLASSSYPPTTYVFKGGTFEIKGSGHIIAVYSRIWAEIGSTINIDAGNLRRGYINGQHFFCNTDIIIDSNTNPAYVRCFSISLFLFNSFGLETIDTGNTGTHLLTEGWNTLQLDSDNVICRVPDAYNEQGQLIDRAAQADAIIEPADETVVIGGTISFYEGNTGTSVVNAPSYTALKNDYTTTIRTGITICAINKGQEGPVDHYTEFRCRQFFDPAGPQQA